MDVLEKRLKQELELMKFDICSKNCFQNFSNKNISSSESICIKACFSKINEAEKVIDKLIK